MTIRPVVLNGMIQRTDDVSVVKHQEDQKPVVDQQNIQVQMRKEEQQMTQTVRNASESELLDQKYDAREEGKGKYQKRGGKRTSQKAKVNEVSEDRVIKKNQIGGFDMKI